MSDQPNFFHRKLKELRILSNMTQDELAEKLSIARSSLANFESGKRIPDQKIICTIASYFGLSEQYFSTNQQQYFPMDDDKKTEIDITKYISNDTLDISDITAEDRIALIEYYYALTDKHRGK